MIGDAPIASSVGFTASRAVPHLWARQEVAGPGPIWANATLVGTGGSSAVTVPKHTYVPPAIEIPSYDADGNLVWDGRWLYAWDGENRLKEMSTQTAAVLGGVPDLRLTFAYDAQSRRIRRVVEHSVGVGSWQLDSDTRFIYDGWNLLAEVEMHNSSVSGRAKDAPAGVEGPYVRRSYLWGPDVSGTIQGAGGVGGLLAVRRHPRGTKGPLSMWTAWDLNGNIIGLHQNTSRSALTANYDYDPFGKPLRVSEPEEDLNPFRFSTKYTDAETGLCYYGYRYYDAVRGRWINRDPIEEGGGTMLYGFVENRPTGEYDLLGLVSLLAEPEIIQSGKLQDLDVPYGREGRPFATLASIAFKVHEEKFNRIDPVTKFEDFAFRFRPYESAGTHSFYNRTSQYVPAESMRVGTHLFFVRWRVDSPDVKLKMTEKHQVTRSYQSGPGPVELNNNPEVQYGTNFILFKGAHDGRICTDAIWVDAPAIIGFSREIGSIPAHDALHTVWQTLTLMDAAGKTLNELKLKISINIPQMGDVTGGVVIE